MNTRTRNLLTLALATALAAPLAAAAQSETTQDELDTQEQTTEAWPPQAEPLAEQQVDPPVPVDEEDPMNAVPPPVQTMGDAQSTGAEQSADHSDVAQRARWTELDVNGDGRIDAQEAAVDVDFNANFEMMDADSDGFVTDAEFRTHAMASPPRNDGSMEHEGMKHEGMEHDGMKHEDMKHEDMEHDRDDATDPMDGGMDDAADDGMDESTDDAMDDGIEDPVDG